MQCINDECTSAADTRIVESRKSAAVTYRVHLCTACGHRYNTVEVVTADETIPQSVRKPKEYA